MCNIKILFIIGLLISCYTDIKRQEIPIEIFVNGIILAGIVMTCIGYGRPVHKAMLYMVVMAVIFVILALWFKGGGGDIILMLAAGLYYGKGSIYIVIIAMFFLICAHVIQLLRRSVKEGRIIPFAPYVAIGIAVFTVMERRGFLFTQ